MLKVHVLIIIAFASLSSACSTSKKTSGKLLSQTQPGSKSFQKIFFVVPAPDIQERVRLENDLVETATSNGYRSIKSLDVIPYSLDVPRMPTKEEINLKAREIGCDAVLVVSVLHKEEAISFNKGVSTKANAQFLAGLLGSAIGKQADNINPIPASSTPGSYTREKEYFIIQSVLYDVATEEIMHFVQSPNFEASSMDKIRKNYTATLIAELETKKLLKK